MTKLNATGSALVYSTLLGGAGNDTVGRTSPHPPWLPRRPLKPGREGGQRWKPW